MFMYRRTLSADFNADAQSEHLSFSTVALHGLNMFLVGPASSQQSQKLAFWSNSCSALIS